MNYVKTTIRLTETAKNLAEGVARAENSSLQKVINDALIHYTSNKKRKIDLKSLPIRTLGLKNPTIKRSAIYSDD